MSNRINRLNIIVLGGLFGSFCYSTIAVAEIPIGQTIGNLSFKDTWFLPRTILELGEKQAYVIVFTTTDCPLSKRVLPKLNELAEDYEQHGVQFLAMNVSPEDDIMDVAFQALDHDMRFPFVKDIGGQSAAAVGATRTPEVVVLDSNRVLRYRGRVNDQYRLGGVRARPTREDLQQAIEDVLANREVAVPEVPSEGCFIPDHEILHSEGPEPNYAQHIAPLIKSHCIECHRPNTAAPFSLISFEQVARKAKTIAEVVEEGRMPPWFAHPEFGKFTNVRRLTSAERQTIIRWAGGHKLQGDLKLAPELPNFSERGWIIGQPDLVITDAQIQKIPADGFIDYRIIVLPYVFKKDTWIQQFQLLPGNPDVVHHVNIGAISPLTKGPDGNPISHYLHGFVPGGNAMNLKNGLGMKIPAGSSLVMQVHYVTTGKPETDQISVGIRFAREPIQKEMKWITLGKRTISIPAGNGFYGEENVLPVDRDITLVGTLVHMHLRGKDATLSVETPDGSKKRLLVVPNYSFDWQLTYAFDPMATRIPKGSRLVANYHWDNSPFNPYNPDPTRQVPWGEQTEDEMMACFMQYTEDAEELNLAIDPQTGWVIEPKELATRH